MAAEALRASGKESLQRHPDGKWRFLTDNVEWGEGAAGDYFRANSGSCSGIARANPGTACLEIVTSRLLVPHLGDYVAGAVILV